jgi:hypothetical protein
VLAGISPLEFWQLTPYQTRVAMEAAMERADKQAWMIAAFTRTKKMPKWEALSRKKTKGPRPGLEKELKAFFGPREGKKKGK